MFVRTLCGLTFLAGTASAQQLPTYAGTAVPQQQLPAAVVAEQPAPKPSPAFMNSAVDCCGEAVGAPGRFWARNEWLYWATSGQPLPILATAAPGFTGRSVAGVLGTPNTVVLYGDNRANKDFRNGYRLNLGTWLDDCRTCGIEGDFFFLGDSRNGFSAASNGSSIIARPFVNALTGLPDVQLVSFPGVVGGSLIVDSRNSTIGGGVNAIKNICGSPCGRLDWLLGYRYWNVADDLSVSEHLTSLAGLNGAAPGTTFQVNDRFQTSNNFHGELIGLSGEKQWRKWFIGGRASVALGVNCETVDINGSTTITSPGGTPSTSAGGLLAQTSNIGHFSRSVFAAVPEVGARVGCQVRENVRIYAAYNFLYISSVLRAGDQIDPRVNPNLIPPVVNPTGPALPAFTPKSTDFWAQGISLGVELRY